ncbi:hypothetical protein AB0910_27945 [Streptomyces sp. NPDC047002]|uniref:hypothetical protein n=1 Tax=Streptomyces sp. NPDC047002 TaxID=3155475 RepID=UPI003452AF8B
MSQRTRLSGGRALRGLSFAALATAFALPFGIGSASAAPAAPAAPAAALSCDTGRSAVDDYTGFALCQNTGSAPVTFWVHLVCGWAPDVDGNHVTVGPGQSSQSTAHCGSIGTGIGEISVVTA